MGKAEKTLVLFYNHCPQMGCGAIHPIANATNNAIKSMKDSMIRTESALAVRLVLP